MEATEMSEPTIPTKFLEISAFEQGPFDGPIVHPDRLHGVEQEATAAYYKGRSLSDVTVESIERHHWDSFMHVLLSDGAYLHYLPVLMKMGVEHQESDRVGEISDSITSQLRRMAEGDLEERRTAIVSHYNRQQLSVVVRYLEHMATILQNSKTGEDAATALRYWRQLAEQAS